MSIHKIDDGVFRVRWREGGRNKSVRVRGSFELAKKIERKKMSLRDENRHLDVKKEINYRMSELSIITGSTTEAGKLLQIARRASWRGFDSNWVENSCER
jgi:hypothetical protein